MFGINLRRWLPRGRQSKTWYIKPPSGMDARVLHQQPESRHDETHTHFVQPNCSRKKKNIWVNIIFIVLHGWACRHVVGVCAWMTRFPMSPSPVQIACVCSRWIWMICCRLPSMCSGNMTACRRISREGVYLLRRHRQLGFWKCAACANKSIVFCIFFASAIWNDESVCSSLVCASCERHMNDRLEKPNNINLMENFLPPQIFSALIKLCTIQKFDWIQKYIINSQGSTSPDPVS